MNAKVRTKLQPVKPPVVDNKVNAEMEGSKPNSIPKAFKHRLAHSRERKVALQQDVDKLKKKLRHEENVHRALERAFHRPLGTLPRLPPYLPPVTLELLAEVAVLEEEIVRLEEQVVHFRQDLYHEAVHISNSKRNVESFADLYHLYPNKNPKEGQSRSLLQISNTSVTLKMKPLPSSGSRKLDIAIHEDVKGKENQVFTDSANKKRILINNAQPNRTPVKRSPTDNRSAETNLDGQKLQLACGIREHKIEEASSLNTHDERPPGNNRPNKLSEDIIKCLCNIFKRMSITKNRKTAENLPFLSALVTLENDEGIKFQDPYGICSEFGPRDIGPYKHLFTINAGTVNLNRTSNSLFLLYRLKLLLGKLASANLQNLTHQEKLAFWINIYNSCMMNAFLEFGIPEDPEMVVALMQKATINVGGYLLSAITIEHFILRLPYHSRYGVKNDEMVVRSKFGLDLSEPLVTFALSCGSWSSPAVRVYTASEVENELEVAKQEYLQAAIGVSARKFAIPKLLDWYLLDFAKDFESLLDWICLQLPNDLGKESMKCLERGKAEPHSQFVQVMLYEFSFRYLLCTSYVG